MLAVLLPFLLVALHGHAVEGGILVKRGRASKPYRVPISEDRKGLGNDGPWSTFALTIGEKPRTTTIQVLPSNSLSFILAIRPDGCTPVLQANATFPFTENECRASRGGVYDCYHSSSTCKPQAANAPYGISNYQVVGDLGFNNYAVQVGWDTVTLGFPDGGGTTTKDVAIAQTPEMYYTWTGLLGLSPIPNNFSDTGDMNNPKASLLTTLKKDKVIPSLSFSYTAGSLNRNNRFGSLVLGGMDLAQIREDSRESPQWFPFFSDAEIGTSVYLAGLNVKKTPSSTKRAVPSDGSVGVTPDTLMVIDTNRPYFYLPPKVCEDVAAKFGLTLDKDFNRYLINETQHAYLSAQNPSLEFRLQSVVIPEGQSTYFYQTISLPYSALALSLTFPQYPLGTTRYLPILPSPNQTYVLGRTLLQEAVLTVDYERRRFLLSPAAATVKAGDELLKPILPKKSKSISGGLIAAIVVVIIAITALIGLAVFLLRRRRNRKREQASVVAAAAAAMAAAKAEAVAVVATTPTEGPPSPAKLPGYELDSDTAAKYETDGQELQPPQEIGRSCPLTPVVEAPVNRGSFGGGEYKYAVDGENRPVIRVYYEMDASPQEPGTMDTSSTRISSASPGIGTHNTSGTGVSSLGPSNRGLPAVNGEKGPLTGETLVGGAQHPRLRALQDDLPPASPIPSTPLEYYGRPAARLADALLPPPPPIPASDLPPASPIPATPLEYYEGSREREKNAHLTPENEQRIRDWVGRAPGLPGLPGLTVTPATPASTNAAKEDAKNNSDEDAEKDDKTDEKMDDKKTDGPEQPRSWVGGTQHDWVDKGLF